MQLPLSAACSLSITGSVASARPKSIPSPASTAGGTGYLYLMGGRSSCESMGLFIQANPVVSIPGMVPIVVTGSNRDGAFSAVPLSITGSPLVKGMNLHITGKDSGGTSRVVNLVITGANPNVGGVMPLFVQNDAAVGSGSMRLHIRGDGMYAGYMPFSESLGLFIERGPNAGMTLFLCNNNLGASAPLFIIGAPLTSFPLPLFIQGYGGTPTGNVPMSIKGDVFKQVTSATTLVIPAVVGFTPESAQLYIHGFEP
jgi:hypothetical protein